MVKEITSINLPSDEEDEFERLMADMGAGSGKPALEIGLLVKGQVISKGPEFTFVDLGGKAEGAIETRELADMEVEVGDDLEVVVVQLGSEIRLSRSLANDARNKELLQDAFDMKLPLDGKITGRNKGGFEVTVAGERAFMPVSHLAIESIEDLDAWIGRSERFLIIEYSEGRSGRLVVSRANLIRRERELKAAELWDTIQVGDVMTGTVRSIMDYGCFVDLGGLDGLVHVREMKWGRVNHPSELVSQGETVTVTVASIDHERKRIGLSMKSADADPWRQLGTDIKEGQVVDGEVTRLESYGVFVEILPGVEGLCHVSEITHLKHVRHPREFVEVGAKVQVNIQSIDHVQKRLSLSMKDVEGDPWRTVEEDFAVGTQVTGTIERVAPFGVFVLVAPGVTALLPGSETLVERGGDLTRQFKPGETVTCAVLSIDAVNKRMSLSQKSTEVAAERANIQAFRDQGRGGGGFGTMADLFKGLKLS